MPGLSGSDVAYRFAIADEEPRGKTRADSTRAGFFYRDITPVSINGSTRRGMIQSSIRINLNTGDEPHRASFDFKGGSGFVPLAGHTVVIGHGTTANKLFSGRILKAKRTAIRNDDKRPTYQCEAAGWVFDLNISRVQRGLSVTSLSPRSIVGAIINFSEPRLDDMGFTFGYVSATLPIVAEFTTGPTEPVSDALARMFRGVDAVWFADHDKVIHAFDTIDPAPGGTPSTLTSTTSAYWGLSFEPTDISRVFANVQVLGASQATLADVDTTYHKAFPLPSATNLYEGALTDTGSLGVYGVSDSGFLVGAEARYTFFAPPVDRFQTPESHLRVGQASVAFAASASANTITVVGANVSSMSPLREERWYNIGGNYVYVASVLGAYSLTAGSVAYNYYVPSSPVSGAIAGYINSFTNIAPLWNFVPSTDGTFYIRNFPAGTNVRVMAAVSGNSAVASLVPEYSTPIDGTQYWTRTFDDGRLSPGGARQVANEALARGAVDAWQQIAFTTREAYSGIGRPVYVSIASPAEPSGRSIVGTFTAQDVEIGGFGRLTNTRGPERTVRAGAVRRPTLWQILQGV
jgi:hypothetical protein